MHVLQHLDMPCSASDKPDALSTSTCISSLSMLIQTLSQGFCHQLNKLHDMLLLHGNLQICMQREDRLFPHAHVK